MLFFAPDPNYIGAPCLSLPEERREVFFPEKGGPATPAKKICRTCPQKVRDYCLEKALEFEQGQEYRYGVWGGKTVDERRKIERARRAA